MGWRVLKAGHHSNGKLRSHKEEVRALQGRPERRMVRLSVRFLFA